MPAARFLTYAIALMIAIALFAVIRSMVSRRRRPPRPFLDDENDRPAYDIPVLFPPRAGVTEVDRSSAMAESMQSAPPRIATGQAAAIAKLAHGEDAAAAPVSDVGGTIQLLPGRLEPVSSGTHEEIRFVRTPGVKRFTFGRSTGSPLTHIQLRAPTTSRMHAYMEFEHGRWRIGNMSETNRVLVNGSPVGAHRSDQLLEDGDRIEFGEVAFVFRER